MNCGIALLLMHSRCTISILRVVLVLSLVLLITSFAFPQGPDDPGAGLLPFSTQVAGAYESVNLATGSVFVRIPVRSKAGKLPFNFSLSGNFHPWIAPIYLGLRWNITAGLTGGPSGLLGGRLSWVDQLNPRCTQYNDEELIVYGIVDGTGALHPAPVNTTIHTASQCGPAFVWVTATDDSGLTAYVSWSAITLYDKSGNILTTANTSDHNQKLTDPDNVIMQQLFTSWPRSGHYADTLNQTAISFSLGTSGTPDTYTFTGGDGTAQIYTVSYATKTLATAFNCTNPLVQEAIQTTAYLPSTITLNSTGETYTLQYEQTPGYSNAYSTGRLTEIKFPSGGSVSYGYSDSNGHHGIECHTGVVPTLTRKVDDNNGNVAIYTYVSSDTLNGSAYTVTADYPYAHGDSKNSTIVYSFKDSFQTQVQYYQGAPTGTPLRTVLTCYNGNTTTCVNPPSVPLYGVTQTDVYTSLNGSSSNRVITTFDSYGNVTSVYSYDFGGSTLLSATRSYYGQSYNGSSGCNAYASGYIRNTPCYTQTMDSTTVLAKTQVTYSNTGHPTSTSRWVSGSNNWLPALGTVTASYNSNGTAQWVKDAAGNQTSFTYAATGSGGCNGLLLTSTTYPLPAVGSDSQTWDCGGGVMKTSVDVNRNPTTFSYNDPLWRLTEVASPDNGDVRTTYYTGATPWYITTNSLISTGNYLTREVDYDGLGRVIHSKLTSDPAGTDAVDTSYDKLGNTASVSNPHRSTSSPTDGTTSYNYDALGRLATIGTAHAITRPDGSHVDISLLGRAVEVVGEGTNSGGSAGPTKVYQRDGLGRLVSACEATSAPQMGNGTNGQPYDCVQDIDIAKGFLTTYGYDALGNLTSVSQPSLSGRSYVYDGLSRLTQESNPESGTTSYTYDCSGQQGDLCTRTSPKANQTGSATVKTTYSDDALHRLTGMTYDDNLTWSSSFVYDTAVNGKGRLNNTASANGYSSTYYNYDTMGRVVDEWQCTPVRGCNGGAIQLHYTYDLLGTMTSLKDYGDGVTYTYQYNNAEWLTALTSSQVGTGYPATLLSIASSDYDPLGQPLKETRGDGYTSTLTYNNRGWLTSKTVSNGSTLYSFSLGYAPNGNVTGGNDSINGNWAYAYDDFNRLSTSCQPAPCTHPAQAFQYLYDQFGNRWQQNVTAGTGPSPQYTFDANNHIQGAPPNCTSANPYCYDAAGNLLNDSFHTYQYDGENRLFTVDTTKWPIYDAFGRRADDNFSGTNTDWIYGPGGVIWGCSGATYGGGCSSTKPSEIYAGSRHVATYANANTYFDYGDWLGTVRTHTKVLPNTPNDVCQSLPFGDGLACAGAAPDPMHFTDQILDFEGLTHFLYRDHSTTQGRWIVPDPAGMAATDPSNPQTWNRYAYVLNNPLSFKDPTGLECVWDDGSYDSNDDPNTGSPKSCTDAGGSRVDHSYFQQNNLADWSAAANAGIANYAQSFTTTVTATPCSSGGGVGVSIGGDIQAGNGATGQGGVTAIVNGQEGGGLFYDSNTGLSTGTFVSGAAIGNAGGPGGAAAIPKQTTPAAFGAFAGGGVNFFATDGASPNQISGPFDVFSLNFAWGIKAISFNYAKSGKTWMASVSVGPMGVGGVLSWATYTSNTRVLTSIDACK